MSPQERQERQERRKTRIEEYLTYNFSKTELVDILAEAMAMPIEEGKKHVSDWLENERTNFFESEY